MSSSAAKAPVALTPEQSALAESHVGLAVRIARGWMGRCRGGIDPADLEQAGMLGLLDAARRFDGGRNVSFAAFASVRIRGEICDLLRAHDPLTRGRRRAVREIEGTAKALESGLGRKASATEVAQQLGWDEGRVGKAMGDAEALKHGWAQVQDATVERVEDEPCGRPGPHENLAQRELREAIAKVLTGLPEREKLVLSLYYFEEMPIKAIADILAVTESRVSQIHTAALGRLRAQIPVREALCA